MAKKKQPIINAGPRNRDINLPREPRMTRGGVPQFTPNSAEADEIDTPPHTILPYQRNKHGHYDRQHTMDNLRETSRRDRERFGVPKRK